MKKNIIIYCLAVMLSLLLLTLCKNNPYEKNTDLPKNPQDIAPLIIGKKIQDILVTDILGKEINLRTIIAKKPTVLVYYRGIWCMYCNQQISQLKEINQSLSEMGFQLVAVSSDKIQKNIEMIEKYEVEFPILSDSSMKGAKSLGIAYDASEVYKDMLLVLEENSGMAHHILPVPAVFILNQEGVIVFEYINPDFKTRLSPELLLTAAKVAFEQY